MIWTFLIKFNFDTENINFAGPAYTFAYIYKLKCEFSHLPEGRDKLNWIPTSENYEKICLNKWVFFLNLGK
jgi:hypothetical protein